MLSLPPSVRIFVARRPVDMRRSFDGLSAVVIDVVQEDPQSGHVFVFFNRRRDRIKLLVWDRQGFWLAYKRLERGTFESLAVPGAERRVAIDRVRLAALLDGVSVKDMKDRARFPRAFRIPVRGHGDRAAAPR